MASTLHIRAEGEAHDGIRQYQARMKAVHGFAPTLDDIGNKAIIEGLKILSERSKLNGAAVTPTAKKSK